MIVVALLVSLVALWVVLSALLLVSDWTGDSTYDLVNAAVGGAIFTLLLGGLALVSFGVYHVWVWAL